MSIKLIFFFFITAVAASLQSSLASVQHQANYYFENNLEQSCEIQFRFIFGEGGKQEKKQAIFDNFYDQTSEFLSRKTVEAIGTFFIGPSPANDPGPDLVVWGLRGSCEKNKKEISNFIKNLNGGIVQYHAFQNDRPLSQNKDLIFRA